MRKMIVTSWLVSSLVMATVVPAGAQDGIAPLSPAVGQSPAALADEDRNVPDPGAMAGDVLIVRPVSLAATAVGAAIYVVALPFAALAGDVRTPGRALVAAPAWFTFKRRVGDFESHRP